MYIGLWGGDSERNGGGLGETILAKVLPSAEGI